MKNTPARFISLIGIMTLIMSLSFAFTTPVHNADNSQALDIGTPTPGPETVRGEPPKDELPLEISALSLAPGYCSSSGGSTSYEYINGVSLIRNTNGTYQLMVSVFIANPSGCTSGNPCPEYDNSPENVNAWVDWNGNHIWEESERVMDKALTGYLSINYFGTMTAVATFAPPPSATGNPTWFRANLGWGSDPNDPCLPSWTWGNVVDQEVQFKVPKIEDIAAQGVDTKDDVPETGSKVRLEAVLTVPSGYQITKCSWTGDLTVGEGDTSNNCLYEYTPNTGPGPDIKTYGEKNVTLTISYAHTASGSTGKDAKNYKYKVFFNKDGDDDDDCAWWSIFSDCEPNWFEYWKDDGAVPGLAASDVVYSSECGGGTCYGAWDPSDDKIYLNRDASNTHYPTGINVPAVAGSCPGGSFGGAQGIDSVTEVLAHERRHETIAHNWNEGGAWNPSNGDPWADSDDSNHPTKGDFPADDLPDNYESAFGTSTSNVDSCNLATHKSGIYIDYGDNEFDAMTAGNSVFGVAAQDWANPGKNTGHPVTTGQGIQVQHTTDHFSGPAHSVSSETNANLLTTSGFGELTNNYSESVTDTDGDDLYDYLVLTTQVQIAQPETYQLLAWIEDGSGTKIAWAGREISLAAGTHDIDLLFDGRILRASELDGPYTIAKVKLLLSEHNALLDAAENVLITSAYAHTSFDSGAVVLDDSYVESVQDSDSDGLFDLLRIDVAATVEIAGTYEFIGELEGTGPITVNSSEMYLSKGSHSILLEFSGQEIFQSRQDGPYHLKALRIKDANGDRVHSIYDAYTTTSYSFGQFEHSGSTINAESFADSGIDTNGDGDYDYLRIQFETNIEQDGKYRLLMDLKDDQDNLITSIFKDLDLINGLNSVALDFNSNPIFQHAVNGPYEVTSAVLMDHEGAILDQISPAHTTQAYNYTDFSQPLVSLPGTYQEHGNDTDTDGLYDSLDITIAVVPGDDGVIIAQGELRDKNGLLIGTADTFVEMIADSPQTVTLSFDGDAIYGHKANGPYSLSNLYIYHTGDAAQGVLLSQAYTTIAYNYKQFGTYTLSLISPLNSIFLPNKRPTFDWNDINGASSYNIQVSKNSSFTNLVINIKATTSNFTPKADLSPNTMYWWRVKPISTGVTYGWSAARTFTTANPPGIPSLIGPANNFLTKDYTPKLDWSNSTTPPGTSFHHYQIQIALDPSFSAVLLDANTISDDVHASMYIPALDLTSNTKFYWRVRSYNSTNQYSSWSAIRTFRTVLESPALLVPADANTVLELRPLFDWSTPPGLGAISGYTIQISKNSTFTAVIHTGNPTNSSYIPTVNLPKNTPLYWRVLTKGTNGPSAYSSYRSFTTPLNPPATPSLLLPAAGALLSDYTPTFTWKITGASPQYYRIQVDNNADFSSPIINDSSATMPTFTPSTNLMSNAKYYWRVRAVNAAGELSNWSVVRNFRAAALPPALLSPADGATAISRKPLLDWSNVLGNTGYVLQVWKAGATPVLVKTVTLTANSSQYQFVTNLSPNTAYFWKVQTKAVNGSSAWSTTFEFMTGP